MADELISKLRVENASLISELKKGVSKLQTFVSKEKEIVSPNLRIQKCELPKKVHARAKLDFRAPLRPVHDNRRNADSRSCDRSTPSNTKCRKNKQKRHGKIQPGSRAITSTPMVSKDVLESQGNQRHNFKSPSRMMGKATNSDTNASFSLVKKKPKSILITPDKRKVCIQQGYYTMAICNLFY